MPVLCLDARRCQWWNVWTDPFALQNLRMWFLNPWLSRLVSAGLVWSPLVVEKILCSWTLSSGAFLIVFGGTKCFRSLVTHFFWEWLCAQIYSVVFRHSLELHFSSDQPFPWTGRGRKYEQLLGFCCVSGTLHMLSAVILEGGGTIPSLQTEDWG